MNRFAEKHSVRAQGRALATEVEALKKQVSLFVQGVDTVLKQYGNRLGSLEEAVLGISEVVGTEEIQAAIDHHRQVAGEARVARQQAQLDEAIKEGYVLPTEAITEKSYLVGVETDKNDSLLAYGPQQCAYTELTEEFKKLLIGKKVGDVVETPTKGKFEVTGVYTVDEDKRQAIMKEKAEKAAAAAKAETETPVTPAPTPPDTSTETPETAQNP